MKEMIKREKVLDMVSINNIKTLEQADEILEACKASDSDVVETYVQNAITRGAVYHKLIDTTKETGEYFTQSDISERYNSSIGTINNYISIFNGGDIVLRKLLDNIQHDEENIKPTLRSLLDTIAHDPNKVSENILMRISHNKMSADTERKLLAHLETASENIRYEYSKKGSVSNGKLLTAFESGDMEEVLKIIKLNGNTISQKDFDLSRKECKKALKEKEIIISELEEENEMLKRRNKFLTESFKLSDVRNFLNRALKNKGILKRYKPELEDAFNILGVDASIDEKKLKKAYKEQVSLHHSDITGDDEMFRKIIEANKLVLEYVKGL